jgi:hypothetical protein
MVLLHYTVIWYSVSVICLSFTQKKKIKGMNVHMIELEDVQVYILCVEYNTEVNKK